ncbi:MAG: HupE/UreJ family protein [Ferruginibacter sp.]
MQSNNGIKRSIAFIVFAVICCNTIFAHDVVIDLEKMSKGDAAWLYVKLGFQHILPLGFDHILFVLSLFLLSPKLKPIMWQSLAFTLAHSVTLGLAMYNVIKPSSRIVEPLIALSIMYVALENIFSPKLKATRIGVVFLFGLVHGMGFAGALQQLGLPQHSYFSSLIMFNLGVELGQLAVILLAFFFVGKWFGDKPFYRKAVVIPLSVLIVVIAGWWTVERIFI